MFYLFAAWLWHAALSRWRLDTEWAGFPSGKQEVARRVIEHHKGMVLLCIGVLHFDKRDSPWEHCNFRDLFSYQGAQGLCIVGVIGHVRQALIVFLRDFIFSCMLTWGPSFRASGLSWSNGNIAFYGDLLSPSLVDDDGSPDVTRALHVYKWR